MVAQNLYMTATGCTGIETIRVGGDYQGPCQTALITCETCTLGVGDVVEVDIGREFNHGVVFHGYCKEINPTVPDGMYQVRCYDDLILASDFLVVSEDPNEPLTYSNIAAETLVQSVLALASLTNFSGDSPGFTFGTVNPVKVQLIKSWDFVRQICEMLAWWCYCDETGQIHFVDRKPYLMAGDTPVQLLDTGDTGDLVVVNHTKSDENTRNKVVVYGADGIVATAQASPPPDISLPEGFYKTVVISYPDIIDTQQMAQDTAEYNLTLLNRTTETITLQATGNHNRARGQIVSIDEPNLGLSGNWFVYECQHSISPNEGHQMHMTLSK